MPEPSSATSGDRAFAPPPRFDHATLVGYEAATPSQQRALEAVRRFVDRQAAGPPSLAARAGALLGSLFGGDGASGGDGPQGLYLVGPVGTGKTHLLAATYHALTPEVPAAFLHASTLFRLTEHPTAFAARVADRARVVCLDEVEIDDAANEARLVLVLQHFEQRGVQLLATSNVEPEDFLANQIGPGRFRRFLRESFGGRYEVVFVGGEDYRRRQELARDGRGWIGPPEATRAALDAALAEAEAQGHAVQRLTFAELLHQATEVAHERLIERLAEADRLAVEGIAITGTDDALRLLRLIDALYTRPDAPALFFTAEAPPEAWFDPDAHAGLAKGIAEKFTRTVSRLYAMCEVTVVGAGA